MLTAYCSRWYEIPITMAYGMLELKACYWVASGFLLLFLIELACVVLPRYDMFLKPYARRHRVAGLVHSIWLIFGFVSIVINFVPALYYDLLLGLSGIVLTLTAASDFRSHRFVTNTASGTLQQDATVTYDEMLEHSFYQALNLVQVVYLHTVHHDVPRPARLAAAALATAPWAFRDRFPVNRFSDNYTKQPAGTLVAILYRLKKYQYLLYKHCLLHGLNITVAISGNCIADNLAFRLYWMCLNTSYVMEFFLQTLVKRRVLGQQTMLQMQQMLMLVSTFAALQVMGYVWLPVALLSLVLNLVHRHHDVTNTVGLLLITAAFHWTPSTP